MSAWISTAVDWPEEGVWVFIATESKGVAMAFWDGESWVIVSDLTPLGEVTHWQPLPRHPEDDA